MTRAGRFALLLLYTLNSCGSVMVGGPPIRMEHNQVLITFVDLTPAQMLEVTRHKGPCIKGFVTEPVQRPGEPFVRSTLYSIAPEHWGDDERIYVIGHEVVHQRAPKSPHSKNAAFSAAGSCP